MKKLFTLGFILLSFFSIAQAPNILWSKNYGGTENDGFKQAQITSNNELIILGETSSTDIDLNNNYGISDIWITKIEENGDLVWSKNYGGSSFDEPGSITYNYNGGYIFIGSTQSNDNDISVNVGGRQIWVVNIDSLGTVVWEKTYGGTLAEDGNYIIRSINGGYILCGTSRSSDGDVSNNYGNTDFWVVKIDTLGNIEWEKNYGGTGFDEGFSIENTDDGGYIVIGETTSNNVNVSGHHNTIKRDIWVIKINSSGQISWQKCLGGIDTEKIGFHSIKQTQDLGFIICGHTYSVDGDITANYGNGDAWIIKLSNLGSIQWQKCYGGSDEDYAYSISELSDGNLIFTGYTYSQDYDVSGNHEPVGEGSDIWVVKVSNNGNLIWQKCIGGNGNSYASDGNDKGVHFIKYNEITILGASASSNGDIPLNYGNDDGVVIKLNSLNFINESFYYNSQINLFPNPTNQFITIENTLGLENNYGVSLFDISGMVVINKKIYNGSIDISSLSSGSYIMKIEVDGNVVHKMVQVMK